MKGKRAKHKKSNNIKQIIIVLLTIILLVSILYAGYYLYNSYKEKQEYTNILDNIEIEIDTDNITETKTERMLKLEELRKQNDEIIGWLEIKGTNINYPVCQAKDNDYYLTHNHKKENASSGSLFLDKDFDLNKPSTNYLIYGHRHKRRYNV